MNVYNIGDVVSLRGGGPKLTVELGNATQPQGLISVVWISEQTGELRRENVKAEMLTAPAKPRGSSTEKVEEQYVDGKRVK